MRAARNVVVVAVSELAGKIATLVFTIVAARHLGPAGFGAFSYALAFSLLLATLPSWGFDTVLIRRGSADAGRLDATLAQTLAMRTIVAAPVFVLGALVGAIGRPSRDAQIAVAVVLIASILDTYSDAARSAAGALEKRGRTSIALVVQRVANAVFAVVWLESGGGLLAVCTAYAGSALLGLGLNAVALRKVGIRPDWSAVDRPALADMWRASFVLGIDSIVAMALFRVDTVMLGAIDGDEAVASYAVAYRLLETVLFVNWAVTRAIFPAMSRTTDAATILRATERGLSVVGVVFVPYAVILIVEGRAILELLFGAAYLDDATAVLRWLSLAPLAFALSFLGSNALMASRRNRALLLSSLLAAVLNVAANLVLIPLWSGVGAAITTTLAYLVEGVAVMFVLAGAFGWLRVDRALAVPVLAAPPLAAILVVVSAPVLVEIAVGGTVYLVTWFLLAARYAPDQVAVVRSIVGSRR